MIKMNISKKLLIGAFASGAVSSLILLNFLPSAQAQTSARVCSLQTLNGAYGIKFEGQKIGTGPFVSIARIVFDGKGQFSSTEIGRFNGKLIERKFVGPYKVNPDCTGYLDFDSNITTPAHEAHGDFVIVDRGQEFYVVDNEEGWATNGVGKKI
jgi:hypothetical protein